MADGHVKGAAELSAALNHAADTVNDLMEKVVLKSAVDLCSLVQINADKPSSGPPGPRNITGDYVGSWRVEHVFTGSDFIAWAVGTDRPQANRLEYGFTGTDSIGRTYDQPPYPHMGPAVDVIDPNFQAAMDKVAEAAIKW